MAGEPITDFLIEEGKALAKKAIEALAVKVAEAAGCVPRENDNRELITQTFCLVVREVAGSDEKEWQQNITDKLEQITSQLTSIHEKISQMNAAMDAVVKQLGIVQLQLNEILRGSLAYNSLTQIQTYFEEFSDLMAELAHDVRSGTQASNQARALRVQQRLRSFYQRLLDAQIHQSINLVFTSLVEPVADKASLLSIVITRIGEQLTPTGKSFNPLEATKLFQSYVGSFLIELEKGNVMYSQLAQFVHLRMHGGDAKLPYTVEEWATHYRGQERRLLDAFNTELERMVLLSSIESAGGSCAWFLTYRDEFVFASADRFTSLMGSDGFGLRGRIFSMGNRFSGKIKISVKGTVREVTGVKHAVSVGRQVDWWVARSNPAVYDEVRFSDTWAVYRYHLPELTHGDHPMTCEEMPYTPGAVRVEAIDSMGTPAVYFGSFTEVQRAGGAFAFLSGGWSETKIEDTLLSGHGADKRAGNCGAVRLQATEIKVDRWRSLVEANSSVPPSSLPSYNSPTLRTVKYVRLLALAAVWGKVEFVVFKDGGYGVTKTYTVSAACTKKISSPETGQADLVVEFTSAGNPISDSGYPSYPGDGDTAVGRATDCSAQADFRSTLSTNYGCNIHSGFDIKFSGQKDPLSKSIKWNTPGKESKSSVAKLDASILKGSLLAKFEGKEISLSVEAHVNYSIETSGLDATTYSGQAKFLTDRIALKPRRG